MLIDYLKKELKRRQKKNTAYSNRAFAKALGVDSSTLAKILAGKRKLSFSMAKKITDALAVEPSVKSILLLSYSDLQKKFPTEEDYFVPDENLSAELMSKWEYYTVLSYLEIDNTFDTERIAQALGTNEANVSAILKNLISLDVIKPFDSQLKLTGKNLTAPKSFNRHALVKVHKENIEKSLMALTGNDLSTCDFSGITIAMSSKRFKEATERIKQFRRSLAEFLTEPDGHADIVYRMNFQFYPVTKRKS